MGLNNLKGGLGIFAILSLLWMMPVMANDSMGKGHGGQHHGVSKERKAEAREKIKALRIYQLTEVLQLESETSTLFFNKLATYDEASFQLRDKRHANHRQMRHLMSAKSQGQTVSDAEFTQAYQAGLALRQEELDLEAAFIKDLEGLLTPFQIAQFIQFEREFERRLRKAIRASKRGHDVDKALQDFHHPPPTQ